MAYCHALLLVHPPCDHQMPVHFISGSSGSPRRALIRSIPFVAVTKSKGLRGVCAKNRAPRGCVGTKTNGRVVRTRVRNPIAPRTKWPLRNHPLHRPGCTDCAVAPRRAPARSAESSARHGVHYAMEKNVGLKQPRPKLLPDSCQVRIRIEWQDVNKSSSAGYD